jgi:hypothetical protein
VKATRIIKMPIIVIPRIASGEYPQVENFTIAPSFLASFTAMLTRNML